jgi:hypothetical protein
LLGARSVPEWDHARQAAKVQIPADLWAELRHEALIPEDAPTP